MELYTLFLFSCFTHTFFNVSLSTSFTAVVNFVLDSTAEYKQKLFTNKFTLSFMEIDIVALIGSHDVVGAGISHLSTYNLYTYRPCIAWLLLVNDKFQSSITITGKCSRSVCDGDGEGRNYVELFRNHLNFLCINYEKRCPHIKLF